MLLAVNQHIFIQRPLLQILKEKEKNMQKKTGQLINAIVNTQIKTDLAIF